MGQHGSMRGPIGKKSMSMSVAEHSGMIETRDERETPEEMLEQDDALERGHGRELVIS